MEDNLLFGARNSDIRTLRGRFRIVMKYVISCYYKMLEDNVVYNQAEWKASGTKDNKFEDYLRDKLVSNYLDTDNCKDLFVSHNNSTNIHEIFFHKESEETYTDGNGQKGKNKNDIYVSITNLRRRGRNSMEYDENESLGAVKNSRKAWFQIECKILDNSSNQNKAYVEDIYKFIDREYEVEWMPFGGQIAFVKKGEMPKMVDSVNEKLSLRTDIQTAQQLLYFDLNIEPKFEYSYQSIHTHRLHLSFDIYHLFLDYKSIIV